jgi:hypothetical protein
VDRSRSIAASGARSGLRDLTGPMGLMRPTHKSYESHKSHPFAALSVSRRHAHMPPWLLDSLLITDSLITDYFCATPRGSLPAHSHVTLLRASRQSEQLGIMFARYLFTLGQDLRSRSHVTDFGNELGALFDVQGLNRLFDARH